MPEDKEQEENDANENEIQSRFARLMVQNVVQTSIHPKYEISKVHGFFFRSFKLNARRFWMRQQRPTIDNCTGLE